jgi:hypothetical protein
MNCLKNMVGELRKLMNGLVNILAQLTRKNNESFD